MESKTRSRNEIIAVLSLVIAFVTGVAALLVVPEVREFLHLKTNVTDQAAPTSRMKNFVKPNVSTSLPPAAAIQSAKNNKINSAPIIADSHTDVASSKNYELPTARTSHDYIGKKLRFRPEEQKIADSGSEPYVGRLDDQVIVKPEPVFPNEIVQSRGEGRVIVDVSVDEFGHVSRVYEAASHPALSNAAKIAASKAIFPVAYKSNGRPVKYHGNLTFTFNSEK